MPIVILLDNSLSMCKYAQGIQSISQSLTYRQLSHIIICNLLDYLSKNDRFERLALIAFSSTAQIESEFTRDYSKIRDRLDNIKTGDTACIEEGLNKVSDLVIDEYACFTNIQILLITNNHDGFHHESINSLSNRLNENQIILKDYYISNGIDFDPYMHLNSVLNDEIHRTTNSANVTIKKNYISIKYPFSFPYKFNVICLTEYEDEYDNKEGFIKIYETSNKSKIFKYFKNQQSIIGFDEEIFKLKIWESNSNMKLFYLNELIELNNSNGSFYMIKMLGTKTSNFFEQIFNDLFKKYTCKIKCGHLEQMAIISPPPLVYKGYQNYSYKEISINRNLEICSFVSIPELTTVPTVSRHTLLSISNKKDENISEEIAEKNDTFLALLHMSLKSEVTAAIVNLDNEWYGAISCLQDSKISDPKKKSNLMLTIFVPGNHN